MIEFIQQCFAPANLAATVLLLLIVLYWLTVIVGVLGMDAFDIDLDADVDADVGIFGETLRFFHFSEMPVMILASFFVLFFWATVVLSNHYFNPQMSLLVTLYCFIPNLLVSLFLTKLCTIPLVPLFRRMTNQDAATRVMIGRIGLVSTSELNDKFGQISIQQDGPPIVVNARTSNGQRLVKSDVVKIVAFAPESGVYIVESQKSEKK